jgi:hypothetical protein
MELLFPMVGYSALVRAWKPKWQMVLLPRKGKMEEKEIRNVIKILKSNEEIFLSLENSVAKNLFDLGLIYWKSQYELAFTSMGEAWVDWWLRNKGITI